MGGRGGSFNHTAESVTYRNALNQIENRIKHDRVETAVLLDKNGNTIFTESQGYTDSVYFSPDQFNQMRGRILTHNHPSGSTFSGADIDLLVQSGMKEIRATSTNQTYRLQKLPGAFLDRADFSQDFSLAYQANKTICDKKYHKYEGSFNAGRLTQAEFADKCIALNEELNTLNSNWLKANSRRYGYRYGVIRRK